MTDLTVALDPPYPVRIRTTFREAWSALSRDHGDRSWFVVADRRLVESQPRALAAIAPRRRVHVVTLTGGESCKTLRTVERLTRLALEQGLDREGLVVAVGGGTVGDVTGFFAASYLRGVRWCVMPTTVLSMADSAVGGKTGVNFGGLKNQVGAFHQPVGVYGAIEALRTLRPRHRVAGLAEVVKSAVILDAGLFGRLEERAVELADPRSALWPEVLGRCCAIKAAVVASDPQEAGERAVLNFGHTVGHALESVIRPRLHHGEAVALGMVASAWLSERVGGAPPGTLARIESLLRRLGLPTSLPEVDLEPVLTAVRRDKKGRHGRPRMVLTAGIGSSTFGHAIDERTLRRAVSFLVQSATA